VLRIIALDSGPSGLACDNPKKPAAERFRNWMIRMLDDGRTRIILPEVADYEVRRKLLSLDHGMASVRRLDELVRPGGLLVYLPINTTSMRRAARLWSEARRGGYSTADEKALDGDVILAAQALEYIGASDRLIVATGNDSDLSRYVGKRAQPWEAITP
jgi:predicted nucleic acid-binding protein